VLQLGEGQLGVVAGRWAARHGRDHQTLPQDRRGVQGRVDALFRLHDQRQVQRVREQVGDEVLGAALVHVQADVGVRGAERAQHGRDQRRAQAGRRAQPDLAAAQADDVVHRVAGRVGVGDHPAGQRQQRLAGRGERDGAAHPVEQRRAEGRFQRVNLLTQRGLRHTHRFRRMGEMPGIRHREEVPKLLQLHLDSLPL
jgi:hypothetical protein